MGKGTAENTTRESTTKVVDVGAEAESNNIVPNITVKWGVLVEGIGLTFAGIAKMLAALDPQMTETIAQIAAGKQASAGVESEEDVKESTVSNASENAQAILWHEKLDEEKIEVKAEPKPTAGEQPAAVQAVSTVTIDDVTKVIVKKIKQNRGNNEKIGSILKTYGVGKVSELPQEKYEAFLTDLAQL